MTLGRLWAGRAYGTNTGNLFVKLDGDDEALTGTLHLNDPNSGIVIYSIKGTFDGHELTISGKTEIEKDGFVFGTLEAIAKLNTKGDLTGEWHTSIGSAGTFILFPHDRSQTSEVTPNNLPDQLHTARHQFGAVEVDREQITAIAEEIQRDFKNSNVIVTVVSGTEQSRFLPDFKTIKFSSERATIIKIFARESENNGVDRIAQVEFGPEVNIATTQGGDEAWVLGMLEKLKRHIQRFERTYATNFKRLGFGINQILLAGTIVFLPSLSSLSDRGILMAGVLLLIFGVNWLHRRYLPFAAVYLGPKPKGFLARIAPSVVSWIIAATAGIAATLLAAYLQGWLGPAFPV